MQRMKLLQSSFGLVVCVCLATVCQLSIAQSPKVIALWPDRAPDDREPLGQEQDQTKPTDNLVAGKKLIRLGNVSKPTLSIYQASTAKPPRPAVIVCPGGGYQIL